jgi:hypothetical protein
VQTIFQSSLNNAIVLGVRPSKEAGLGLGTCEAVEHVPEHHPDAEARLITDAYDAFARKHGSAEHRGVRDVSPVRRRHDGHGEQAPITGLGVISGGVRWARLVTVATSNVGGEFSVNVRRRFDSAKTRRAQTGLYRLSRGRLPGRRRFFR